MSKKNNQKDFSVPSDELYPMPPHVPIWVFVVIGLVMFAALMFL